MGYQAKFDKAFEFQQQGDFHRASQIYHELIKKKPKLFDAQQMLGICYHEQGELKNSIHYYQKALSINPKHSATLNNLGNVFLDSGELNKAKQQFDLALKFDPTHAAAYNNLGNYYQKIRDFRAAIAAYEKASAYAPADARYYDNLGVVFYKTGAFAEALKAFQTAHNLAPTMPIILLHMFDLLTMMQQNEDAVNLAISCIQQGILSQAQQMELHVGIAKAAWIFGDVNLTQQQLSLSSSLHQQWDDYPNITNFRVFHRYLTQLVSYRKNNPELYQASPDKTIVMFSESHGFAPSQTQVDYSSGQDQPTKPHQIVSFTVTGCKVWHLAQSESNMYRESVKILMEKLPQQCSIILGFGEIDCRIEEGIYHYCHKYNKDFFDIVPMMIEDYVKQMKQLSTSYQHHLIFYGVPAPREIRLAELSHRADFINLVKLFNQSLRKVALNNDCDFLDIYQMTCDSEGVSNETWHIDDIHLKPEAFNHLFTNHLVR